ncbi:MAG: tetratricopeptide repeat protein [bacterium]|nr:tetratricopeptide repeat protein [bacterium]
MENHRLKFCTIVFCTAVIALGRPGFSAGVEAQNGPVCIVAQQDYQVALQSYKDSLFDPAIAGFEGYLQKCPGGKNTPQAHYFLADILYKQESFLRALRHVAQSLALPLASDLLPYALLLAAQSSRQLGQIEQAEIYLKLILDATESAQLQSLAFYWLGELASQQQRYTDALVYYRRAVDVQPNNDYAVYAQYALGWTYRRLGDVPAALNAFSAFLALSPRHEQANQARFVRATLLREAGQLEAARTAFAKLADEAPDEMLDEVRFWWAEIAYQLEAYGEAAMLYQRLIVLHPHSARIEASLYGWGWAEIQQNHCASAHQPWETLLQQAPRFPRSIEIHYQLGACYGQLGLHKLARKHLLEVVGSPSKSVQHHDATLKLASLAFQNKRYTEAIRYYSMALVSSQNEARGQLYYLLGESYAALGKQRAAIEQWQQVLADAAQASLRAGALYRIGQIHIEQKTWHQAISVLRQLWDEAPNFADRSAVAAYLVKAYQGIGQCADAFPYYDAMVATSTKPQRSLSVISAKAMCLYESKRYQEVMRLLAPQMMSEVDGFPDPLMLYVLGQTYLHLQQDDAAVTPLSLLQQSFPQHTLTKAAEPLLAKALERLDRRKEALAVWQVFLQREPLEDWQKAAKLRLHIGRLALQEGLWAEALDVFAPVREAALPSLALEALFWSAEVYLKQQQWELALQVYQRLVDTYSDSDARHWRTLAKFRIGVIYEHQQDWEGALRIYRALQSTTTDREVRTNVQQRIAAIQAGRVDQPQPSPLPSSDG